MVQHGDHVDFVHDGHRHRQHGDHWDLCDSEECAAHSHHEHVHGPGCGHQAVPHGDHVDYLHDGHLHARHDDHWDEH